jgi:hypothetical protein
MAHRYHAAQVSRRLYVFAHNNLRLILALLTGAVTDMCVYLWAGAYQDGRQREAGCDDPGVLPPAQSIVRSDVQAAGVFLR